jgi:hypothetical protein
MRADGGGSHGGNNSRVGLVAVLFLVVLVLLAQFTVGRLVDCLPHMVLAPIVSVFSNLFFLLFIFLGWHSFPRLIPLLIFIVGCILLVLPFLAFLTFVFLFLSLLGNGAELGIELELPFQGAGFGRHGHNLLVVGRFGSPITLEFKVVHLGLGSGHESLVGTGVLGRLADLKEARKVPKCMLS